MDRVNHIVHVHCIENDIELQLPVIDDCQFTDDEIQHGIEIETFDEFIHFINERVPNVTISLDGEIKCTTTSQD